ncbi:MAG: D-alanyl-D-alanine carboxypeptidase family protein [Clostridia bacterium]|nr:D-alanyl-D-alanine carboxypeptidase family protein [Clostridia bacterium]
MNKHIVLCLLLCALMVAFALPPVARADFSPDSISTPYMLLMDADTGLVLSEKQGYTQFYPASTTKILSCIIAIEMTQNLDERFNVGPVTDRGSCMGLREGEEISMRDLLYGLMLVSGNDAADAVAYKLAGGRSEFAELMNQKAAELGMTQSNFVNANGLHDDAHVTTAYDMAVLARYAMQNDTFRAIVSTREYTTSPTSRNSQGYSLVNSNRLLATPEGRQNIEYAHATGIKTGNTIPAGYCLVASASKDGRNLILVLLGDNEYEVESEYRFQNAATIFDWAFESLTPVTPESLGLSTSFTLRVNNASSSDIGGGMLDATAELSGFALSLMPDDISAIAENPALITAAITDSTALTAPIRQGDVVGTVTYSYNGTAIYTANLIATRDVDDISVPTATPGELVIEEPPDESPRWLLVWILLAVLIIVAVLVIMLIASKKSGRIRSRRRGYYVTKRR